MKRTVSVRPAIEADLAALTRLDLSYPTERVLALERSGQPGEERFTFRWRNQEPGTANYAEYSEGQLREALPRVDLFLTAEVGGEPAGLLIVIKPPWSDAGEITDLAVHRPCRRCGVGRALVDGALQFARSQGLRALWAEPRADNGEAIDFYLALGFRLSGFNDRMYSNRDHEDGRVTLFMYQELT